MNATRTISTTAAILLLGFSVPAYAGQEKQEEKAPPAKQEQAARPEKQEETKAPKQEQQAKPEKQQQAKAPKQQQEQAKSNKQQHDNSAKQEQQAKGQQEQHSQQQVASSHGGPQRTQQAQATQHAQPELRLSDRGSGRIPDDRFRSNFGRGHFFRMGNPVMVSGYSRFQYGGYWFGFVEPWPVGWYYTDQFYIDYVDGGYYMYDPYNPGARFAITVVI
jgi:flagellar motor protein MotB